MAIIRKGKKSVLIILDTQIGVVQDAWDAQRITKNICEGVDKARKHNVPVIWVQQTDDELVRGSPDWQIVPELLPAAGEPLIEKQYNSCFENTRLEEILAGLGTTHLFLAGAATNWCIRASAYAALERGYDLTLIKDAHSTGVLELEGGSRVEAKDIIDDANATFTWVSYPGRTSSTVSADELDFDVN